MFFLWTRRVLPQIFFFPLLLRDLRELPVPPKRRALEVQYLSLVPSSPWRLIHSPSFLIPLSKRFASFSPVLACVFSSLYFAFEGPMSRETLWLGHFHYRTSRLLTLPACYFFRIAETPPAQGCAPCGPLLPRGSTSHLQRRYSRDPYILHYSVPFSFFPPPSFSRTAHTTR